MTVARFGENILDAAAAAGEQEEGHRAFGTENSKTTEATEGPATTARYALKHLRQGLLERPEKFAKIILI